MFIRLVLISIFHIFLIADTINIQKESSFYDILSHSEIYIDKTKHKQIDEIKHQKFEPNHTSLLGYGYSPDFNVWIKFTLHNTSNKHIYKLLEYANSMTTDISFYDGIKRYQDGLLHINSSRKTINPTFDIYLNPHETKTYYIEVSSYITTLIIKLNLWEKEQFYKHEIKHQLMLGLFFGAMFILGMYNLFIFFFTKDISYLFYVIYIFGITLHHSIYTGISHIYFLNQDMIYYVIKFASIFITIPIFALGLFTKSFLNTKQYPIWDNILILFLILLPISTTLFILTDEYNKYRNLFPMILLIYLILITIYASLKKNRQSYFIFFGWFIILIASIFMYLSSIGIFNIYQYFNYYVETSLVLEAIIFSIALADRIKQLQTEKDEANQKLITQKQNETARLEVKVAQKTKDLKIALDEKVLLFRELNHRVKNNMQMIVSLIRLQADEIEDSRLQDMFLTIQNRINAMGHLHQLLYKQDTIVQINAYEYFENLIEEVQNSYDKDVDIVLDIQTDLQITQSIYCGLILNELITNSLKYAFDDQTEDKGTIYISLKQDKDRYELHVKDNGKGYQYNPLSDSLGLVLVKTLAIEQLGGTLDINSNDGVETIVSWKIDDEI